MKLNNEETRTGWLQCQTDCQMDCIVVEFLFFLVSWWDAQHSMAQSSCTIVSAHVHTQTFSLTHTQKVSKQTVYRVNRGWVWHTQLQACQSQSANKRENAPTQLPWPSVPSHTNNDNWLTHAHTHIHTHTNTHKTFKHKLSCRHHHDNSSLNASTYIP